MTMRHFTSDLSIYIEKRSLFLHLHVKVLGKEEEVKLTNFLD